MTVSRSEIREDLLTLEDAALLADPAGQLPNDTMDRVRRLVRSDPIVLQHKQLFQLRKLGQVQDPQGQLS